MQFTTLAPGVDYYENMFTDYECEHIIEHAKPLLSTSLVAGNKDGFVSPGRVSSNCWLPHNKTPVIKNICDKIAYVTCNKLDHAEKMQVIHYEEGGKYNPHYDGWDHDNSEKQKRNMKYGGQRLMTALVYLNDVAEGGGTSFPKKNVIANAKKGCMVVFKNCIDNTNIKDPTSIHAGMPVIQGEKWAFNLWFREKETSRIMYQDIVIQEPASSVLPPPPSVPAPVQAPMEGGPPLHAPPPVPKQEYNEKLEEGDYVPFISWVDNSERHLHNFVDNKHIIIVISNNKEALQNIHALKNLSATCNMVYLINNESNKDVIAKYFTEPIGNHILLYALNCERRIMKIVHFQKDDVINMSLQNYSTSHVPFIEIPNVLSNSLLREIVDYYYANENRATLHDTATKNRTHVHPNAELEKKIDEKLRKTAYYKMKDVFNFEVKYRELYKICCYDSTSNGRFHAHRDTVPQYSHRVYGMSLLLNDDYEGGELEFPEYNIKLKPKANSAIIFPGTYSHKVLPVLSGKRMTIISFLCKEIEGKTKNNKQYMVKG